MSKKSKQIARIGANSLSIIRGLSGSWLAYKFESTPPEKREWALAHKVAGLVMSDAIDGKLGRYADTTQLGTWLDQMSDKAFVLPPMIALAKNGEIDSHHWKVKLGRDVGVTALRSISHINGGQTAAQSLGKLKAATEMAGLVVAASPLSHKMPELTNKMFEASTTLNIVSGLEYTKALGSFIIDISNNENYDQIANQLIDNMS